MTKLLAALALSCLVGVAQAADTQPPPAAERGESAPLPKDGEAKGASAKKGAPARKNKKKGRSPAAAKGEGKVPPPQGAAAAEKPCEPVKPCPIE